jgi:hypothetical protein
MKLFISLVTFILFGCDTKLSDNTAIEGVWVLTSERFYPFVKIDAEDTEPDKIYNVRFNQYRMAQFLVITNKQMRFYERYRNFLEEEPEYLSDIREQQYDIDGNRLYYVDATVKFYHSIYSNHNTLSIATYYNDFRPGTVVKFYELYTENFEPNSWNTSVPKDHEDRGNFFVTPLNPNEIDKTTIFKTTHNNTVGEHDIFELELSENTNYELSMFNQTYKKIELIHDDFSTVIKTLSWGQIFDEAQQNRVILYNTSKKKIYVRVTGWSGYYRLKYKATDESAILINDEFIQL